MRGVVSAGSVENRSTPAEWASADATQGRTQSGRSVQQRTSVRWRLRIPGFLRGFGRRRPLHQPTHRSLCPATAAISTTTAAMPGATAAAMPGATAAIPGTSRQAIGSDVMESVRSQQRQCARKPDLPGLRYQAARDFFKRIDEVINARKPGVSEAKKSHNPESTDEYTLDFSNAFARAISESFERSGTSQDVSGKKNTLLLCRIVTRKTIEAVDRLIKELRNARESGSSEAGVQCNPGQIEQIANEIHQFLKKLETDKEIWTQYDDPSLLCQAIVAESLKLDQMCDDDGFCFMRAVTGPVYMLALNGALVIMKEYPACQWSFECLRLLFDISQRFDLHYGDDDLLISNLTMLQDLFLRPVLAGDSSRWRVSRERRDFINITEIKSDCVEFGGILQDFTKDLLDVTGSAGGRRIGCHSRFDALRKRLTNMSGGLLSCINRILDMGKYYPAG